MDDQSLPLGKTFIVAGGYRAANIGEQQSLTLELQVGGVRKNPQVYVRRVVVENHQVDGRGVPKTEVHLLGLAQKATIGVYAVPGSKTRRAILST